jgi:hypothetical protein
MFSVTSFIYVAIPVVLVIATGMLIRKRGNPDTAGRRFFLFLIWTGVGLLATICHQLWLMLTWLWGCDCAADTSNLRRGRHDLSPPTRVPLRRGKRP